MPDDDPRHALFNVYVTLISVVSVWMAWSSIAWRHDIRRHLGRPCRLLFGALAGCGLFVLSLAPRMPEPAPAAMARGSLFPALKPWVRTAIRVAWMSSALRVRLWAGRRFLARQRGPGQAALGAA